MILDLGACPDCDLEVRSGIRLEMAKIRFFEILTGSVIFDIGVGFQFWKLE